MLAQSSNTAESLAPKLDRRLSIAPMLEWTDRFFRYFLRLISRHTLLYTEMVTTGALLHGDPVRWLRFDPAEHPLALQLGGSDPVELAACARLGEEWNYDEINLNLGCPSDRVQSGRFGACLMAEPERVADCLRAMGEAVAIPVTVKHRIGIERCFSYGKLCHFVATLAEAGCQVFIVHARQAWLQGLSAKENRTIPPLRYEVVHRLKRDFPRLQILINGGITTLEQATKQLHALDGVMIGRAAYQNPWILAAADCSIFGMNRALPSRRAVLAAYLPFMAQALDEGVPLVHITRHLLGLYQGIPGARAWRRCLSEQSVRSKIGLDIFRQAVERMEE